MENQELAIKTLSGARQQSRKNAVNLKEAEEWLRSAAAEGEEEAWLELGNLKLHSSAHDSIKQAYFWFYLAQTAKVLDAGTKQEKNQVPLRRTCPLSKKPQQ